MSEIFEEFPDSARLWIYQGSRKLTNLQAGYIQVEIKKFIGNWQAHGQPLKADSRLVKDQFLIIVVDESVSIASGCSIDASVNLIKNLGKMIEVNFLDRGEVAFSIDDQVVVYPLNKVNDFVANGSITHDTLTFNNTVQTLGEWKSSWLIPSSKSWLKRYIH